MLSLTKKADYAIVAMADMANRGGEKTSAREIGEATNVPLPVLTNILHQLLHNGLVTSSMGSRGGYCLSRPSDRISLANIIDAIEGPFRLAQCCGGEPDDSTEDACDLETTCSVRKPVRRVHVSLQQFLQGITLTQLASDSVPVPLLNVGTNAHSLSAVDN